MSKTTIPVDAQMLQLLNDRICQTIDALNQVRWSAIQNQRMMGLGFASPIAHNQIGFGLPVQNTWGATSSYPYAQTAFGSYSTPVAHTGFYGQPIYNTPVASANAAFSGIYGQPVYNAGPVATSPMGF